MSAPAINYISDSLYRRFLKVCKQKHIAPEQGFKEAVIVWVYINELTDRAHLLMKTCSARL